MRRGPARLARHDGRTRPTLPAAGVILAVGAILAIAPAQAESALDLRVTDLSTGSVTTTISINVSGDATVGSSGFFLSQSGAQPLDGVHLSAIASGLSATFTVDGGQPDGFTVPPSGHRLLVTLTVSGVNLPITTSGPIVATRKGDAATIAQLVVTKTAAAALTVVGADDATGLKFTTPIAVFSRTLTVISNTTAPVPDLQFRIRPLVAEDSTQIQPSVDVDGTSYQSGSAVRVAPLGATTLTLTAVLEEAGTYAGGFTLVYGTTQQDVKLLVERTSVTPTVAIDDISKVAGEIEGNSVDAALRVSVRESAGHAVTLTEPQLVSLVRLVGGDNIQANAAALTVDGLTQGLLKLGPYESRVLDVHIQGLRHPGMYTGTLRFASPNGLPVDKSITVLIRRGWWLAALLIFFGAAAAAGLRKLVDSVRPRLDARLRAREIGAEVDRLVLAAGGTTPLTQGAITATTQTLNALEAKTLQKDININTDVIAKLDPLGSDKVPMLGGWMSAARRVLEFGDPPPTELSGLVGQIGTYLANENPGPADAGTARQNLATLTSAITAFGNTRAEVDRLDGAIKDWLSTHPTDARIPAIQAGIDQARGQLATGTIALAQAQLANARHLWSELLAVELAAISSSAQPLPGIPQQEWGQLQQRVSNDVVTIRNAASADAATAAFRQGYGRLLTDLARALLTPVMELDKTSPSDELKGYANLLNQVPNDVGAGALDAARGKYEQALSGYQRLAPPPAGVKLGSEEVAPVPISITPPPRPGPPATPQVPWTIPAARSFLRMQNLRRQLQAINIIVFVIIAGAAILVGIAALWLPNATWGGAGDYIIALLWGLGLQPIGNATFQGFGGLLNVIGTQRPQA